MQVAQHSANHASALAAPYLADGEPPCVRACTSNRPESSRHRPPLPRTKLQRMVLGNRLLLWLHHARPPRGTQGAPRRTEWPEG
jgi:hypothetical protein